MDKKREKRKKITAKRVEAEDSESACGLDGNCLD
jgi:hypothetical protein